MQEIAIPEKKMVVDNGPLLYLEDIFDRDMKRAGYGNIRLLRKKRNEHKFGIRLLQI